MKKHYYPRILITAMAATMAVTSCDDFVKIDPPRTSLIRSTVFDSDATATAAMLDIYNQLKAGAFASGGNFSVSFFGSILADEQINYFRSSPSITLDYKQFYENALLSTNGQVMRLWTDLYQCIFKTNAVLEGVATSSGLTVSLRAQLEGEAKFVRAFCYFYLVNLWGDVPLVTATEYRANSVAPRKSIPDVYQRIVADLSDAQTLLPDDFSISDEERVRANRGAATAMLARVYLFTGDWVNAEALATNVIENTALYGLTDELTDVFSTNSSEAILQWWSLARPTDRGVFQFPTTPRYGSIKPELIAAFEAGDQRLTSYTLLTPTGYYSTEKYAAPNSNPPVQYSTVLRLAEQYLIRAEARARQNNIAGAQQDVNAIRHRAGLGDTPAGDVPSLLLVIENERRFELFNEWGHRWLDLKRTGRVDEVLSLVKTGWASTDALWPIPETEITNNSSLQGAQNPGY